MLYYRCRSVGDNGSDFDRAEEMVCITVRSASEYVDEVHCGSLE